MARIDELKKLFAEADDVKDIVYPMLDEVVFLEEQLEQLRKLPMIRYNPDDTSQQKATPASQIYKQMLQQYNNCIKILCSVLDKNGSEDTSPLREYLKGMPKNEYR